MVSVPSYATIVNQIESNMLSAESPSSSVCALAISVNLAASVVCCRSGLAGERSNPLQPSCSAVCTRHGSHRGRVVGATNADVSPPLSRQFVHGAQRLDAHCGCLEGWRAGLLARYLCFQFHSSFQPQRELTHIARS